jgi:pyruvate,water dikinase
MSKDNDLILFFKDIDKEDIPKVGGKGANLGEMWNAGFPVPPGFAVTVSSYNLFLDENNLKEEISDILKNINVDNNKSLEKAASEAQRKIERGKIPDSVAREVIKSYSKISGFLKKAQVAVRSSATAEDLPSASFAGQQATFLNVKGEANLLLKIKECWASLFTPRAIFYRVQNKISHDKIKISVIVQKMVQSEVSGVMFTLNPVTNEKDRIIIEAVWGLGEMIVQGSVVPDHYVVQKDTFSILSKEVSDQRVQLIKVNNTTKEVEVPKEKRAIQKITDREIVHLAKIGQKLQDHYYFPQDVEWAKEGRNIFIVQTRPVTTIEKTAESVREEIKREKALGQEDINLPESPILTGSAASPGIGTGHVKIILTPKEIGKMQQGDVLVSKMTSPDFVPAMKKAAAIITDEGGQTSHAAIVSRELGVPCIVGTKLATKILKEGYVVTVDGAKGQIFLGSKVKITKTEASSDDLIQKYSHTKTATKVYVNLAEPERAKEISKLNVQGVGLLRAEFMIANIGVHPKEAIKEKKQKKFIDKLAADMEVFCKAFHPRPVVYRATDFKTNEYRALEGGKAWEPEEPNPLLGFRGAYRYVSNPEVFNLELQAMKRVREKYDNLWLMVPFVRSPEELARVRRLVATEGLFESSSFKFWMMVELPVNVILIDDFIKVGIDGVSIGSNDLAMLLLGTDRDNAEVRDAYNERSPAVLWSLKRVIKHCNANGVTSSICGQAPSVYEDLVEKLVSYGITSISVNPDAIGRVRGIIADVEKKLIK